MAGRLTGKVALISGGACGREEAEVQLFVKEGAAVLLGDVLVSDEFAFVTGKEPPSLV